VISKAKVPIIKIVDKLTNFQVDVSFGEANGIKAANMVKRLITECGQALRGLMLVLKQFLVQRHLYFIFNLEMKCLLVGLVVTVYY
jgi:DNA polymerase sigma